jgi:hypothetical protein
MRCTKLIFITFFLGLTLVFLTGCSGEPKKIPVRAEEFGDRWPLTISSGHIYKRELSQDRVAVVFVAPDGVEYGLNGTAQSQGYRNIHDISKTRTGLFDIKLYEDVDVLINVGLYGKK